MLAATQFLLGDFVFARRLKFLPGHLVSARRSSCQAT